MMFAALVYPVLEPKGVLLDELLVVEPLPDKGIGNPQCQDAACPRHDRDPMVRFDRRRRPSRVHLNEPPARACSASTETAERVGGLDRAEPSLQEAGPEGKDELGFPEVVTQRSRDPLHELMSEGGFLRREAAEANVVGSSVRLDEP